LVQILSVMSLQKKLKRFFINWFLVKITILPSLFLFILMKFTKTNGYFWLEPSECTIWFIFLPKKMLMSKIGTFLLPRILLTIKTHIIVNTIHSSLRSESKILHKNQFKFHKIKIHNPNKKIKNLCVISK